MSNHEKISESLDLGVIVRRSNGVTRWQRTVWTPVAILPKAEKANWRVLRQDGDTVEYHAATLPLTLWRKECEAYRVALTDPNPGVYVVMREDDQDPEFPYQVHLVTASPHEAALFNESGDEIVEKVPMPEPVLAWVAGWIKDHYVEEPFVKRKRRRHFGEPDNDGLGDPRISQTTDVYRAPTGQRHTDKEAGNGL